MDDYKELFCLVTFTDDEQMFIVPCREIDDPGMAEVAVPFKRDGVTYAITCYITNLLNYQLAILEMVILKENAETLYEACMMKAG